MNKEMSKEQMQTEIHKGNMVIQKLQQKVGHLAGELSQAEAERDLYFSYIQSQEKPEPVPEPKAPAKPKKKEG